MLRALEIVKPTRKGCWQRARGSGSPLLATHLISRSPSRSSLPRPASLTKHLHPFLRYNVESRRHERVTDTAARVVYPETRSSTRATERYTGRYSELHSHIEPR